MANLIEIKKRIESISSTIKVTKVMQMIATAKIAKVKTKIASIEKYNNYATDILYDYLNNTKYSLDFNRYTQYYNVNSKQILFILFSSDKGTCGSINTTIFKEFESIIKEYEKEKYEIVVLPIGRKAYKYCTSYSGRYNFNLFLKQTCIDAEFCDSEKINNIIADVLSCYNQGQFYSIRMIYHKFKNIITCNAVNDQLLPVDITVKCDKKSNDTFCNIEETEDTQSSIVEFLLRTKLYNAYISNIASIISSRMNAMDNATKNGQEIIDELRIKYNKGRQAHITAELSDIVSGCEAIS